MEARLTAGTASCSTAGVRMMLDRNAFTREVARIVPNSLEGELVLLAARADAKWVEAQRHWRPLEQPVSLRDQLAERWAELNGSSAASYRRNRAINAQYKCGKTTLLMNSVRSFVTGDRARRRRRFEDGSNTLKKVVARSSHASGLSPVQFRKSHPVLTNSARDPRQCAVEAARGRRDHPWSAIAPVVGR